MKVQGSSAGGSSRRNDYTSTYDQYKQSTIENVTLAEDLIISDLLEDIPDVKFFYRSNTPAVDDIESEPSQFYNGTSTANYITLTVPNSVIWSTICPLIEEFYVYRRGNWARMNTDIEEEEDATELALSEDLEHSHEYRTHSHVDDGKFYFDGLMKFCLAEDDDEDDFENYHMLILPGEKHTGVYKIVKGTIFLAEMLGGNNRIDKARIVAISANQHKNVADAGIAIEVEGEGHAFKRSGIGSAGTSARGGVIQKGKAKTNGATGVRLTSRGIKNSDGTYRTTRQTTTTGSTTKRPQIPHTKTFPQNKTNNTNNNTKTSIIDRNKL